MKKVIFKKGDKVFIKHNLDVGECTVIDPCDPTDMLRVVTKEPVEFYVRLTYKYKKTDRHGKTEMITAIEGYEQENLRKVVK